MRNLITGKGCALFAVAVCAALAVSLHSPRAARRPRPSQMVGVPAPPGSINASAGSAAENSSVPTAALHQLFRERRKHLLDRCRHLNVTDKFHTTAWKDYLTMQAPGPLLTCVPPKVGSTSWHALNRRLSRGHAPDPRPASAILVRHPLSRLASAYRDKFLGGEPIGLYDGAWILRTESRTAWVDRWHLYWLPTLISSGQVTPTKEFLELVRRDVEAFEFASENYVIENNRVVITRKHSFAEDDISVGMNMVSKGRQYGLVDAIVATYGYMNKTLVAKYGNSSFTFLEFLEFIVWSRDHGVLDLHWSPYTELCDPCKTDYQYILHLETIAEEARVLLKDTGYQEEFQIDTKHRTKGFVHTVHPDDLHYYKDVPKSLLKEILLIFEFDFDVFGYNANAVEDFD
ncbi:uncharacterized protein LOC134763750 [Penaeus indicus]|uniref:uncharacterized protein LOC134763750 n=1 Tax=Penaeus indicus TaxID=29960 RepID=UPI00300C7BBC